MSAACEGEQLARRIANTEEGACIDIVAQSYGGSIEMDKVPSAHARGLR